LSRFFCKAMQTNNIYSLKFPICTGYAREQSKSTPVVVEPINK